MKLKNKQKGFFAGLLSAAPLIGAGLSFFGGERRNSAQERQARQANAFSERLSSTAHQREASDLKAAGLNRILSVVRGSGASSPIGQQASISDTLSPAVNAATQIAGAQANIGLQKEQTITEQEKQQSLSAKAAHDQAAADSLRGVKGTEGEQQILESIAKSENLSADTAKKAQEIKNLIKTNESIHENIKYIAANTGLTTLQAKALLTTFPRLLQDEKINRSTWGRAMRWLESSVPAMKAAATATGGAIGATVGRQMLKNTARNQSRKQHRR